MVEEGVGGGRPPGEGGGAEHGRGGVEAVAEGVQDLGDREESMKHPAQLGNCILCCVEREREMRDASGLARIVGGGGKDDDLIVISC